MVVPVCPVCEQCEKLVRSTELRVTVRRASQLGYTGNIEEFTKEVDARS